MSYRTWLYAPQQICGSQCLRKVRPGLTMCGVTLDCSPLGLSLAGSAEGEEVAMTVPPWLLHQLRVRVCTRVHTRVCAHAWVCPGVCSAPAWDTHPCRGRPHSYTPWSAPSSGKLGRFFLEPVPCGSNPWLSSLLLGLSTGLAGGRSRCQTHFGTGDPPASPPTPVLLLWLSMHLPLCLLLPMHASLLILGLYFASSQ